MPGARKVIKSMMERKKSLFNAAPQDLRKQMFQEIRDLDERISGEEMSLLEETPNLGEMMKERRIAKKEEGRAKVTAKSDVTRIAASGSPTSEIEATRNGTEGKFSTADEEVSRNAGNNFRWRWSKFRDGR